MKGAIGITPRKLFEKFDIRALGVEVSAGPIRGQYAKGGHRPGIFL